MDTETKKTKARFQISTKNLSDPTFNSYPKFSSPPSNQRPTTPKRAVHLREMELSTYDQSDENETHSVHTRHGLLRSHDARSSPPAHTQSPPLRCHTTSSLPATRLHFSTPARMHTRHRACFHTCTHACTHASTHARTRAPRHPPERDVLRPE